MIWITRLILLLGLLLLAISAKALDWPDVRPK